MNRSTGTIILIVVAVIVALFLIIYAVAAYTGSVSTNIGGNKTSSSSIMVATSTSFLVDPRLVIKGSPSDLNGKGVTSTGLQGGDSSGTTPPAPPASKGFFGGLFSRFSSNDIPAGFTAADLSPYWQKVTISNAKTSRSTRPTLNPDSVTLKNNAGGASVSISGWQVKSNKDGITIAKGVRLYHSVPTPLENIELRKGETAVIYTNNNPLATNFLTNKCTGYLATGYPFNPPLPLSCARPPKSDIETFTGTCQDYILHLKTCESGDPGVVQAARDASCRSYIASTLNYDGCVKRYQNDVNFYGKEWRIWVGKSFLDPLHDRVLLLDSNGKLVDSYSY